MRSKSRIAVAAAGVMLIVGLVALGATLLARSHQAPVRLGLTNAQSSSSPSGLSGKWSVGPGSQVGYRVKEKFINQAAETEAVARTSHVTGSVTIAAAASTLQVSQIKFTVDLASLVSQDKYANYQVYQRDFFVRSIYLQTDSFPTATFTAQTMTLPLPALPASGPLTVDVAGQLTVHGVTKPVTAHIQAVDAESGAEIAGSATVDMRDFGIDPPDISFTHAEPAVLIEFDLKLVRS